MQIRLDRSEIEDAVTRWVRDGFRVSEGGVLAVTEITVTSGGSSITCEVNTAEAEEEDVAIGGTA